MHREGVQTPLQPPWKSSDTRAGLLDAGIVCKRHFNHSGSHQMLVQDCLDAGNVCKRTWTSPEAAAVQFMYREGL